MGAPGSGRERCSGSSHVLAPRFPQLVSADSPSSGLAPGSPTRWMVGVAGFYLQEDSCSLKTVLRGSL